MCGIDLPRMIYPAAHQVPALASRVDALRAKYAAQYKSKYRLRSIGCLLVLKLMCVRFCTA
jgi:hypothetical protein